MPPSRVSRTRSTAVRIGSPGSIPSRNTTYAETQAVISAYPVRSVRKAPPMQTTASAAATHSSGWQSWTTAVATTTPTTVPARRATPRLKVWAKSGRITIAAVSGAQ